MLFLFLLSIAVDRSVSASLSDARDALTNAAIDSLTSYRASVLTIQQPGLLIPACLRFFPLYILALLKHVRLKSLHVIATHLLIVPSIHNLPPCFREPFEQAQAPGWTSACLPCVS